jgi:hypothetical protein
MEEVDNFVHLDMKDQRILVEEIRELKSLIEKLEWSGNTMNGDSICPICFGYKEPGPFKRHSPGHEKNCELAEMIK